MTQHVDKSKAPAPRSSRQKFGRWFRLYDDLLFDPKVQLLTPENFKHWINLLCVASKSDSVIPSDNLHFMLHVAPGQVDGILSDLIRADLLEYASVRGDRCLVPHGWQSRQYVWDGRDPTNAERQKRHRQRKRNARNRRVTDGVTVDVTDFASESVSVSALTNPTTVVVYHDENSTYVGSNSGCERDGGAK